MGPLNRRGMICCWLCLKVKMLQNVCLKYHLTVAIEKNIRYMLCNSLYTVCKNIMGGNDPDAFVWSAG